jgi:hypothetical protein
MSKKENFIGNFKNIEKSKDKTYINTYVEKDINIDPFEKDKINKIKIQQALKEFFKDNTVD